MNERHPAEYGHHHPHHPATRKTEEGGYFVEGDASPVHLPIGANYQLYFNTPRSFTPIVYIGTDLPTVLPRSQAVIASPQHINSTYRLHQGSTITDLAGNGDYSIGTWTDGVFEHTLGIPPSTTRYVLLPDEGMPYVRGLRQTLPNDGRAWEGWEITDRTRLWYDRGTRAPGSITSAYVRLDTAHQQISFNIDFRDAEGLPGNINVQNYQPGLERDFYIFYLGQGPEDLEHFYMGLSIHNHMHSSGPVSGIVILHCRPVGA